MASNRNMLRPPLQPSQAQRIADRMIEGGVFAIVGLTQVYEAFATEGGDIHRYSDRVMVDSYLSPLRLTQTALAVAKATRLVANSF